MQFAVDNPYSASLNGLFIPHSYKPSIINEMINKPDIRLEQLLEEEDFIDELKNGNPAVLNYFTKNSHLIKHLVEYIIQLPPDLNDNKRAYQYPLQAHEIFEVDTNVILDFFFVSSDVNRNGGLSQESPNRKLSQDNNENNETALSTEANQQSEPTNSPKQPKIGTTEGSNTKNTDLLSYLFSFLSTKDELNPVMAGYFNNLILKLLRKSQKKVIEFVYNNENILFDLVGHIGQHSISELVPMFLCYEHYLFDDNTAERLELRTKLIDKIFDTLSDVNKPEQMVHIAETLSEILHRNETMANGKEIMNKILGKEIFDRAFTILHSHTTTNAIVHVGNVILTLLGHFTARRLNQYSPRGIFSAYLQRGYEEDPVINSISENFDDLVKFIANENENSFSTTFGQNTARLGLAKLKVIDIVERIVRIDSRKVYKKVNESGIVPILTDMFAKFIWNNLLHTTYEKLIYTILDKRDAALMEALFEKAGFVQFIANEIKEDQFGFPKSQRKIRKGNMGFIVKMANELARLGGFEKSLEDQIKKNPEWENIVVPALKARNELDNKEMGGHNPRNNNFRMTDSLFGYAQLTTGLSGFYTTSSSYLAPQADQQPQSSAPSYQVQTGLINNQPEQKISNESPYSTAFMNNFPYSPEPKQLIQPVESDRPNVSSPQREVKLASEPAISEFVTIKDDKTSKETPEASRTSKENEDSKANGQETGWMTRSLSVDSLNKGGQPQYNIKAFEYSRPVSIENMAPAEEFEKHSGISQLPVSSIGTSNKLMSTGNTELSQIVAKQLQSSNDILNRLKLELNISPTRDKDNKSHEELEEDPVIIQRPKKFESYNPSPISASADDKMFRKSMIEMKSGKKVKLRVKKAEKLDGSKILDMINKFKGPSSITSMTSSMEISCSDNSQSESGNLSEDLNHPVQEGPTQPSDTAAIMAQLLALRDKELA